MAGVAAAEQLVVGFVTGGDLLERTYTRLPLGVHGCIGVAFNLPRLKFFLF